MKVIKVNKFSESFPKRIQCKRIVDKYGFSYGKDHDFCGSELEIDEGDIKKHKWSKYPDYHGVDYGVFCPVCGSFIVLNENEIPDKVLQNSEEC